MSLFRSGEDTKYSNASKKSNATLVINSLTTVMYSHRYIELDDSRAGYSCGKGSVCTSCQIPLTGKICGVMTSQSNGQVYMYNSTVQTSDSYLSKFKVGYRNVSTALLLLDILLGEQSIAIIIEWINLLF
ncbi:hypothetical protein [Pseudoalteromonas rubra]|uniref:Uncharacterized protein n=1 Tax=Pseudoalteromonas rubra TaxID=43658 RepID=A0A5S3WSC7_9GAMM|nr:hypothetical protein [Pseudoalteromonas rubra]TMP32049.1 hypothetical protein CWB98_21930 [Pseudoalteromonas rubra]